MGECEVVEEEEEVSALKEGGCFVAKPSVADRMRECDALYMERFGSHDGHLKACSKLLCMGHPVTQDKLEDLCRRYCRRWTFPF